MSESPTEDGNAEAAKWRRKLRDTEKERDTLAARVVDIQRNQIASLLEREHVTIDALTATGATLADLCDSGGRVDAERVRAAAERARDVLGIKVHAGLHVPAEGKIPPAAPSRPGFASAFAPKDNTK